MYGLGASKPSMQTKMTASVRISARARAILRSNELQGFVWCVLGLLHFKAHILNS